MITCATDFLPVSYGAFSFLNYPIKTNVNVTPIKADDDTVIKYYQTVFEVEMILTNDDGTDADMDTIKGILLTRGLTFKFANRGFGTTVTLNDPGSTIVDINLGPVPQILAWTPLGNNLACRVVWRLESRTAACPIATDQSVLGANQFKILSLVEETELSFDEEGAVVITTNGTIEVANQAGGFLTREALNKFAQLYSPSMPNAFQRTQKLTFRKDHKTVDYSYVDTEIKSDNPFFPYMITQEVSHSVASSLISDNVFEGSGFTTWASDMTGEFTVKPGLWKGWAWIAFCVMMAQRRNRAAAFGAPVDKFAKDDEGENAKKKIQPRQIPLHVRIKESLNSRKVSVNVRWVTHTSILNLFKSTGMFYPVDNQFRDLDIGVIPDKIDDAVPLSVNTQWHTWKASIKSVQVDGGYREPRLPNVSLVFDTCTANQAIISDSRTNRHLSMQSQAEPYRPGSGDTSEYVAMPLGLGSYTGGVSYGSYLDGIVPENSWVHYDNDFEIIEETNSNYIPTIESEYIASRLATNLNSSDRTAFGFKINGKTETADQSKYTNDVIQIRGKPVYRVRMFGYALRVGYQIPCPVLNAVNSQPCFRIGENRWKHKLVSISDEIPMYLAIWDQEYGVFGTPEASNIKFVSSGRPAEFA